MKTTSKKLGLIVLAGSVLAACGDSANEEGTSSETGEKHSFRFAEVNPDGHPMTDAAEKFAELVNEKTDGRIEINIHPAGQLGDEKDNVEGIQMGSIDFMRANSNVLADFGIEKLNVLSLPFMFRDRDHLWNVLNGDIGEELMNDIEEADIGVVGVGYVEEGPRHFFFTDEPVATVADMQGKKVRVQENELMVDLVKSLGASPTPVSYSELYSALQTGVVDGAENPPAAYLANSFHEVAKYLTLDSHIFAPNSFLMSGSSWDKLSEEDQEILKEAGKETEAYVQENAAAIDDEALAELEAQGTVITEVEDQQEWVDAVQPMYEKYGGEYQDLIESIQSVE